MQVIEIKSEKRRIKKVKALIRSVGNQIGSVHFNKRKDGTLRKMAYRLHVTNPNYAAKPSSKSSKKTREKNEANNQLTVFDVNKVVRAKSGRRKGKISGRGAWRTIPLENVKRICVNGEIYKIKK